MIFKLSLFLFCFGVMAQTPYVVKGTTLYEGGVEVGSKVNVFTSTANVNVDGDVSSFTSGEQYMQSNLDFFGRYGLTNNLEFTLGSTLRYNQSKQVLNDETYDFTASGIKSGYAGVKYSFPLEGPKILAVKFIFERNLFENSTYRNYEEPDHIVLGDTGDALSAGLEYTYFTASQNFLSLAGTFRSPGHDLSSEVLLNFETGLLWQKYALYVGSDYNYSLKQDAYTENPEEKPLVSNGNTNLYNSINRSWLEPYLGLGISLGSKWRIEAQYAQRISGVSTDLGQSISFALVSRKSESKEADLKRAAFKEYAVEAEVTKISKGLTTVVISSGLIDDLTKGDKVDFYYFDYLDGNELIASGFIVKVGSDKSLVKITKKYSKRAVKIGTIARSRLLN